MIQTTNGHFEPLARQGVSSIRFIKVFAVSNPCECVKHTQQLLACQDVTYNTKHEVAVIPTIQAFRIIPLISCD